MEHESYQWNTSQVKMKAKRWTHIWVQDHQNITFRVKMGV